MLRSLREVIGYAIEAKDGRIGAVSDFHFDDARWTVRYIVVDTGKILPGRRVLLSPSAVQEPRWALRTLPVDLTVDRIKGGPSIREDLPVSRQHEEELVEYYKWTPYWTSIGLGGSMSVPIPGPVGQGESGAAGGDDRSSSRDDDPHLRSVREVTNYRIHAADRAVGHVEDFIAETEGWPIRYMVVDTRNWLPGRKVLVSPHWIRDVDWMNRRVEVGLSAEEIKSSPEYDPRAPVNREYEVRLYDYYGRPKYWEPEVRAQQREGAK